MKRVLDNEGLATFSGWDGSELRIEGRMSQIKIAQEHYFVNIVPYSTVLKLAWTARMDRWPVLGNEVLFRNDRELREVTAGGSRFEVRRPVRSALRFEKHEGSSSRLFGPLSITRST